MTFLSITPSIKTYFTIRYHLYNRQNVKNTHEGALLIVKWKAVACNFIKSSTAPWVFFTLFKLYKWYQIAQSSTLDKVTLSKTIPFHFFQISNWQEVETYTGKYSFIIKVGWCHSFFRKRFLKSQVARVMTSSIGYFAQGFHCSEFRNNEISGGESKHPYPIPKITCT